MRRHGSPIGFPWELVRRLSEGRRMRQRPQARVTDLRMPSRREAVGPTVERVLALAGGVGLSEERLHDFSVVLAEALSNAAVHGNGLDSPTNVEVRVEVEPERRIVVEVADQGPGFDRGSLDDPTRTDRVLEDNGRGVFLMHRLADELHYNARGNRVRLTFSRLPGS
jgi:serine/threonine-protein kinase RsbW